MDIQQFREEYDNLSEDRKVDALKTFFTKITNDIDQYDDYIQVILELAEELEQDDYWGTEGANI